MGAARAGNVLDGALGGNTHPTLALTRPITLSRPPIAASPTMARTRATTKRGAANRAKSGPVVGLLDAVVGGVGGGRLPSKNKRGPDATDPSASASAPAAKGHRAGPGKETAAEAARGNGQSSPGGQAAAAASPAESVAMAVSKEVLVVRLACAATAARSLPPGMPLPAAVAEQVSALADALAEAQAPAEPAAAPAASPAAALEPPPSSDYEALLRERTPANTALVNAYNRGEPGARYRLKLFYVELEAHARAQPPAAVAAPEAGGAPAVAPASATASDDGTSVSSASTFRPSSAASSDDGSDRAAAPQAGLVPARRLAGAA